MIKIFKLQTSFSTSMVSKQTLNFELVKSEKYTQKINHIKSAGQNKDEKLTYNLVEKKRKDNSVC